MVSRVRRLRRGHFAACAAMILAATVWADEQFFKLFDASSFSEAIKYADENIPAAKRDASVWAKLGIAHEEQQMIEKALACYMVAIRTDAKSYEAHLGAARVYSKLNQASNALGMAKKAMELNATGEASWEFARASIALGKTAEAKSALEKVVETDPTNSVANRELGTIYYNEKDFKKALPLLKISFAKQPDSDIALRLGRTFRELGELDSAITYLKEASRDRKSAKPEATLELGRAYFLQKNYKLASEEYEKANQSLLTAEDFYSFGLSVETAQSSLDKAVKHYDAAAKKFGKATTREALLAIEKLSRHALAKKDFQGALNHLETIYKADSTGKNVKDITFLMAEAHDGLGNQKKAIPFLENAIARDKENVEAYARLADIYSKSGMVEKAQQVYEKLLALQPNSPKIHLALGEYNLKSRKYDEALKNFQKSFTLEPAARAAEGMMLSAWELKKFDLARDAAETALHRDASLREPQLILAKIYIQEKNYAGAKQMLEKLVKSEPDNIDFWKELAVCYEKTGDAANLANADQKICALDKKDTASRFRFARYAVTSGNLKAAFETYKELSLLKPQDSDVIKNLYEISQKNGNSDEAISYLKKYVQLKPADAASQRDLGNLLFDKKDSNGALAAYRAALKADPAIKGFYKKYADLVLAQKGQEQEIVTVLSSAVKAGEADEEIYTTLGRIYDKQALYPQAIEMYQKALQLKPQNFEVLSALASCQEKGGKVSEAIISYEQATAMNPGSAKEQKALGDLYMQQGKKGPAVSAYKKYLDKSASDSKIARVVGDYEFEQKNYKEAIKYLGMIGGEEAKRPDLLLRHGTAAYNIGDFKKTSELFRQLIVLTPKDPEPLKVLYEIARKDSAMTVAADYLKKYVALKTDDAEMHQALGDLLYSIKDFSGSLNAYRTTLRIKPAAKGFHKRYVELVNSQGKGDDVMKALIGAIAANEADGKMYAQLGEIFMKAANYPRAIENLEKASQLEPQNADLLISLAQCHAKSGNVNNAVIAYEQAVAMNPKADKEHKELGDLYMQQNKADAAVKAYRKYLEKNADNGLAKLVGERAFQAKNYADAVKYLGMVGGAEAQSASFLMLYGKASYQAKDDNKALSLFRQLATLTPTNAEVFNTLFEISQRLGSKDDALNYLKKYVALKPADAQAQKMLAGMLYERRDSAGAIAAYSATVKAEPSVKGIYKKYAELAIAGGKNDLIVTVLNGAIAAGEADAKMYTKLAQIYSTQGDHAKAVQMYEKASQLDPKNGELLSDLAQSQERSGNASAAVLTYEQAIAMNPAADKEYKQLGDLYMQQKKTDPAVKAYKKYLEKRPESAIAKVVGDNSFKQKNYTEAIKYFAMVGGEDAKAIPFLKLYAEACYQTKEDSRALSLFRQLSVMTPKDAEPFERLYDISSRTGAREEALTYLKKYVALKPGEASAQKNLGDMLYDRKDAPGAIAAYRACINANPSAKGFYKKYAELVMASGKDDEVIAALNGAIAAGEADVKMYTRLAETYRKLGNHANAVQMYEKAMQLDPKNNALLGELAQSQAKSGKISEAVVTYEQAIAMNPQASREYKELGDLYMKQQKTDQAVKAYRKYLDKNQDNAIAKLAGEYYFKQKNYSEAMKYLGMVGGSDAATGSFLQMFGEACFQAKEDVRGLSIFRQLSNLTPQNADVFDKLYQISQRSGAKDDALLYLKKYAALKPADAKAQKTLGDMLYERKDQSGALTAYRALLKADPAAKGFYKNYAGIVMSSGTDDEKTTALSGAISAGEADARMYKVLADIYRKKALYPKAIQLYEKATQLDPRDADLLSLLAECQAKNGNIKEAVVTYEQFVAMSPAADKEYKALGDLYMKQKKADAAAKAYRKYLEKSPTDHEIAKMVGDQAFKEKNYTDAVKYFGMIIGAAAKQPAFLNVYGEAAYQLKDDPRALRIYKELSILTPKDPEVQYRLYEISTRTGAPEEALVYLRNFVVLKPASADAQKTLGDALYERKDKTGALNAYRATIKASPTAKGFFKRYVELVLAAGTPAEKISALNGAISAGEADAAMHATLGDLYRNSGDYPKAIQALEKASQLDPRNALLLSDLAECQMKTGNLKDAAITFEQALAMNPGAVKEYKMLGDLYMQQKKTAAAVSAYKKFLDKSPTDQAIARIVAKTAFSEKKYDDSYKYYAMIKGDNTPEYLTEYGLSAIQVKDYKNAIELLERLRATKGAASSRDVAYKALADAYERSGNPVKAAEVLNDYVKLPGVNDPDAAYRRAAVYENISPAEAVKMYETNTISYPKDYRNFLKLGIFYAKQNATAQKAVRMLEKCSQLADTIPRVWLELGSLYSKVKRDQDMLKAYRKFLEVDPENAEATGKIGEILLTRNMVEDAMVFLELANSLKENDPKLMTLLARGYIMTKRKNDGAKLLERVVKMTKGSVDDDLRMVLADVYLESGKYREAADELKIVVGNKRDNVVLLKYAKALLQAGRQTEAVDAIENIKATDPENIEAHMMLGEIRVAQKKYNEAIETYKEILYINQEYAPALCARADVYMLQSKPQWAKTFYERALKSDPKCAPAELGMAKMAKANKDFAAYQEHLERARQLDPNNKEILDELRSVKR